MSTDVSAQKNKTPKERARPLDQANSGTCTLHAVVNATGEKLMDNNIDVKLDELIGGMKQLKFVDVENGNHVEEFAGPVVRRMTDQNTGDLYDLKLKIKERSVRDNGFLRRIEDKTAKCVLVYSEGGQDDPDPDDLHCVFISKVITELGKLQFVCINSWGKCSEIVVKEVDRPHNRVFEVLVGFKKSKSPGTSANSKRAKPSYLVTHSPMCDMCGYMCFFLELLQHTNSNRTEPLYLDADSPMCDSCFTILQYVDTSNIRWIL